MALGPWLKQTAPVVAVRTLPYPRGQACCFSASPWSAGLTLATQVHNQYLVSNPQKRPELETPAVFSFLTHSRVQFWAEDVRLPVCVEHTPALRFTTLHLMGLEHEEIAGAHRSILGSKASLVSGVTRCYAAWGLNFSKPNAGFQQGLAHPSFRNAQGWHVVLILRIDNQLFVLMEKRKDPDKIIVYIRGKCWLLWNLLLHLVRFMDLTSVHLHNDK